MRTYLFNILIPLSIMCASCNNNEAPLEQKDFNDYESSILLDKMQQFNDSLLNNKAKTRPIIQPGAWERAQIIASDCFGAIDGGEAGAWAGGLLGPQGAAAGALLGGLLGGACCSYVAWQEIKMQTRTDQLDYADLDSAKEKTICAYAIMLDEDIDLSEHTPKEVNVEYPIENENIILMGAKHNIILEKLINSGELDLNLKNNLSMEQLEIINSKEFTDNFNLAMEDLSNDIKNSNIITSTGDDKKTKLMNMFYEILIKYPEDLNDVEFIINQYIKAVDSSTELSPHEKELIYAGLSVAASSSEFWNEMYK